MGILDNTENSNQKMTSHFYDDYEYFYDDYTSINTEGVINHLLNMSDEEYFYWGEYLNEKVQRLQIKSTGTQQVFQENL